MSELLSELDFSLDMPSDGVVESRHEIVIDSSAPTHTATTNNIIRLELFKFCVLKYLLKFLS